MSDCAKSFQALNQTHKYFGVAFVDTSIGQDHLCNITNTLERKFEQKSVRLRANIFVLLAQNNCVAGMSMAGDWAQPGNNKDTVD